QGRDDGSRVLSARGEPGLRLQAAHGRLDRVERGDLADGGLGARRRRVAHLLDDAPAQMAPAVDECPWPLRPRDAGEPVVTIIAVALQEAPAEALQELFGIGAAAPRRIAEQHDRRPGAAMASVIGGDRPEEALLRLPS